MATPKLSPTGIWRVTTEGDVEGKTTRELGIYHGHIVDIAKQLSAHASYGLTFSPSDHDNVKYRPPKARAHIRVYGDPALSSGNVRTFREWIGDDVESLDTVEKSNYYSSVLLHFTQTAEDRKREADRAEFERLKQEYGW